MMFHAQSRCNVLAVVSGEHCDNQKGEAHQPRYPFPDLSSSGRLKFQVLNNPTTEEFQLQLTLQHRILSTCKGSRVEILIKLVH